MKKLLLTSALLLSALFVITSSSSAQNLTPGQNPDFAVSRDKYMKIADSVNQWHGTTIQQTYEAFDWYEQKQERRKERLQFRRQLQLERSYYSPYYGRPYYGRQYHNNYRYGYPRHRWAFCWF